MKEQTAKISFNKEEVKEIIKQYVIEQGYDVTTEVVVKVERMHVGSYPDEEITDLTEISVSVGMPKKKSKLGSTMMA